MYYRILLTKIAATQNEVMHIHLGIVEFSSTVILL